jgi:type II secretory ATPase GspE/PulE/Tfp pilus assembly ATPase PilB-like protein
MAVAQRLIRTVCKKCSKMVAASEEEALKIKKALSKMPKGIKFPEIKKEIIVPQIKEKGCAECNFTGYSGRVGIFEAFLVDDEIEKMILKTPSVVELKEIAIEKGMVSMYQDGIIKVLEGKTTIEEVEKITGE